MLAPGAHQLLFLLLVAAMVSARPADKRLETARRKARFGDWKLLCNLLCEDVTESEEESDCLYPDWLSFDICDSICEDSDSVKTSTLRTMTTTKAAENTKEIPESVLTTTTPVTTKMSTPASKAPTPATESPTTTPSTVTTPETTTPSVAPPESPDETNPEPTIAESPKRTPETTTEAEITTTTGAGDNDLNADSNDVDPVVVSPGDASNSSSALIESKETIDKVGGDAPAPDFSPSP